MEYPPLVAGRSGALRGASDEARRFQAADRRTAADRVHAGERRCRRRSLTGSEPSRPGAFRVEGAAARSRPVSLGAGRRGARPRRSPRARRGHGVRRRARGERRRREAAGRRSRRDRLSEGAAVDQRVRHRAGARGGAADRPFACRPRSKPLTGGEAVVAAPAAGRFTADDSLISVGATVRAGQALGRLEPRSGSGDDRATLAAAVAEARAAAEAARAEQTRAERLLADRAVPARRVEDARRAVAVADARLERPRRGWRNATRRSEPAAAPPPATRSSCARRSPGGWRRSSATLGASYDEGAPLFRIVRTDRVELQRAGPGR